MRQESHRIFLQNFVPRSAQGGASAPVGGPTSSSARGGRGVVTTSAAVRLTDGARTRDVTKLLRGKFGLPSTPPGGGGLDNESNGSTNNDRLDRIRSRLSEFRGSSTLPTTASTNDLDTEPLEAGEYDALVLVATLTSLPKGFVAFEHEVGSSVSASLLVDPEANDSKGDMSQNQIQQQNDHSTSRSFGRREDSGGGPPSPDVRLNLDRSRSVSSAVTVKASNAVQTREASSISSTSAASDVSSTAKEGVPSNLDPNRDPLEMSESSQQGFPVVKVDRVRPGGSVASPLRRYETSRAPCEADDLGTSLRDGVRTTGSTNGHWAAVLPKQTQTGVIVNEDGTSRLPTRPRSASPPKIRQIHISSPPKRVDYDVSPEPYNIVRTLRPNDSPLAVRDEVVRVLVERLRQAERQMGLDPRSDQLIPTPQVRWFFQPSHQVGGKAYGRAMNVPGCIDLEGYCSGVEDSDDEGDELDLTTSCSNENPRNRRSSWQHDEVDRWWTKGPAELQDAKTYRYHTGSTSGLLTTEQARLSDERHRLATLSRYVSALSEGNCLAGYLLKQSKRDHNIWHRVHCVLTEDCLFWVSRMKATASTGIDTGSHESLGSAMQTQAPTTRSLSAATRSVHFGLLSSFGRRRPRASRIGRHHMIKLTSTLLIESDPTQSSNPLSNVPNSFEIICPNGPSHIFRVPPPSIVGFSPSTMDPRATCKLWVSAIGDRIVRCFEDNGMNLAEMIDSGEAAARWGRIASLSVTPFLGSMANGAQSVQQHGPCLLSQSGWEGVGSASPSAAIAEVLRIGLDVAEYRETILHAQRALMTPDRDDNTIVSRMKHEAITSGWDSAERVLVRSSLVISMVEAKRDDADELENILSEDDSVGSLESLRGEVLAAHRRVALYLEEQKVLRERNARGESEEEALLIPPADAFDDLLEKLQRLAARTEDRRRKQDDARRDNTHAMGTVADLPPIVAGHGC